MFFAASADEAGFWPVTSLPSQSTKLLQSGPFSYLPPQALSISSTRKGTTLVSPTASSSLLVKPVTRRPETSGLPSAPSVSRKTAERSEEHTSELQSRPHLVCRLLLEKKKKKK